MPNFAQSPDQAGQRLSHYHRFFLPQKWCSEVNNSSILRPSDVAARLNLPHLVSECKFLQLVIRATHPKSDLFLRAQFELWFWTVINHSSDFAEPWLITVQIFAELWFITVQILPNCDFSDLKIEYKNTTLLLSYCSNIFTKLVLIQLPNPKRYRQGVNIAARPRNPRKFATETCCQVYSPCR